MTSSTVTVSGWTLLGSGQTFIECKSTCGVWLIDAPSKPAANVTSGDVYLAGGVAQLMSPTAMLWALPGQPAATAAVGVEPQSSPDGSGYAASGLTPVTGSLNATGNSASFAPLAGRPFNISLWGTFSATSALQRSFDGLTWLSITASGSPVMTFSAPVSEQWEESEVGVQYRLACMVTSGTINYRISQ